MIKLEEIRIFQGVWLRAVLLLICAAVTLAHAKGPEDYELIQKNSGYGEDFEKKPWEEMEYLLPKAPDAKNMWEIEVGLLTKNKFFVDELSVDYGSDEVIRYTLVAVSPQGAKNVSYEGMRCSSVERRMYAFGRTDGSWSKARNSQWVRIEDKDVNRHHAALYYDYFCPSGNVMVWNTESARKMLRSGGKQGALR